MSTGQAVRIEEDFSQRCAHSAVLYQATCFVKSA